MCFRCCSPQGMWTLWIMKLLVRNIYIWWNFRNWLLLCFDPQGHRTREYNVISVFLDPSVGPLQWYFLYICSLAWQKDTLPSRVFDFNPLFSPLNNGCCPTSISSTIAAISEEKSHDRCVLFQLIWGLNIAGMILTDGILRNISRGIHSCSASLNICNHNQM